MPPRCSGGRVDHMKPAIADLRAAYRTNRLLRLRL